MGNITGHGFAVTSYRNYSPEISPIVAVLDAKKARFVRAEEKADGQSNDR